MVHDITLNERDLIFNATVRLIRALVAQVNSVAHSYTPGPINIALLTELVHVGLATPGFSEPQRVLLIDATSGVIHPPVFVSPLAAAFWPFEVLRKKDEASEKLLEVSSLHCGPGAIEGRSFRANWSFSSTTPPCSGKLPRPLSPQV